MNDFREILETVGTQDRQGFWQLQLFHSKVCVPFFFSIDYAEMGFAWSQKKGLAWSFCSLHTQQATYTNFYHECIIILVQVEMCILVCLYQP